MGGAGGQDAEEGVEGVLGGYGCGGQVGGGGGRGGARQYITVNGVDNIDLLVSGIKGVWFKIC